MKDTKKHQEQSISTHENHENMTVIQTNQSLLHIKSIISNISLLYNIQPAIIIGSSKKKFFHDIW